MDRRNSDSDQNTVTEKYLRTVTQSGGLNCKPFQGNVLKSGLLRRLFPIKRSYDGSVS